MKKIIYVPLEHLDKRYTKLMDIQILNILDINKYNYTRVYGKELTNKIETGFFLDAIGTNYFKASQVMKIMKMFRDGKIKDGDVFFFSDLWFPGIEAIKYVTSFLKIDVKITGILHAGSWTETDDVRTYMKDWAKYIERGWFKFIDVAFVGSKHHKNEILKHKRTLDADKIVVYPLAFSTKDIIKLAKPLSWDEREDNIIFPHRLHWEKQPEVFDRITKMFPKLKAIKTMEQNLSKQEYFRLLARSKFVFSSALQENFGYGILEAVTLGCIPIVPDRLSYREYIPKEFRYKNLKEAEHIIKTYFENGDKHKAFKDLEYLNNGLKKMFEYINNWYLTK